MSEGPENNRCDKNLAASSQLALQEKLSHIIEPHRHGQREHSTSIERDNSHISFVRGLLDYPCGLSLGTQARCDGLFGAIHALGWLEKALHEWSTWCKLYSYLVVCMFLYNL
ncbi:hypothetical protein GOP47_0005728 [Adiantum capillus-veneris]|uniref:Uncharacterized protein n=1 Tax=Adiantum capillus-veneris TaxID=13818 RepID=A0A9D4V5P5_ADICA|nr:hypothetical protein GOP47_0005728 [Adiantum capillus-veneris]